MRQNRSRAVAIAGFIAGIALSIFSGWASADPPSRVARLGYLDGAVSFSPAGEDDWVQATINRPMTIGDRLWTEEGARAEVQIGGAVLRMGGGTGVSILNLDDRIAQLQITQGTIVVRVRRLEPEQVFEVDTPNLAFTLRQPGEYRMEVEPDGTATSIFVRRGQGEVYGEDASYVIGARQPYRFVGTGLREYEHLAAARADEFDRWSSDRDRRYETSVSARYVSPDVVGYQDLDTYGTWRNDPNYGNVWVPTRVEPGWAPYRNGHWAWIDPWGWTWVDDAPWGFAVTHYGRWAYVRDTWSWVPGPVRSRAYYAPALVAFVGGSNFSLTVSSGGAGSIGWFPLAPREVYRPAYPVSRRYFQNVNVTNTVVNTTVINNYYDNVNVTNVNYANRRAPNAVVAVPTAAFVQSRPVSREAVRVQREAFANAPVAAVAPLAPTERSVRGAAATRDQPPQRVFERRVVARSAPAPAPVSFAAQERELAAKAGRPLDDAARRTLKAAAPAPVPTVSVVRQAENAPPAKAPPPAPAGGLAGKAGAGNAPGAAPPPSAAGAAPAVVPAPAPRTAPAAPPPQGAPLTAPPQGAPPRAASAAPPAAVAAPPTPPNAPPAARVAPAPQPAPAPSLTAPVPQPEAQRQQGGGEGRSRAERRERAAQQPPVGAPPSSPQAQAQQQVAPPQPAPQPQQRAAPPPQPAPQPQQRAAPPPQPVPQPQQRAAPPPQPAPQPQQRAAPPPQPVPQPQQRAAPPPQPVPQPQAVAPLPPQKAAPQPQPQERAPRKKDDEKDKDKQKG